MKKPELVETTSIMNWTLDQLLPGIAYTGSTGADLTRRVNETKLNGTLLIARSELGEQLKSCFDAAFMAGITAEKMKSIRVSLSALDPAYAIANIMKITCYSLSLIVECRCLGIKTFQSRQEIDSYLNVMNAAFDEIEELSGDEVLSDLFAGMNALRCAVMRDLTERSKPLPRLTAINLPKNFNSLVLAYDLYEDVDKAKELCLENSVVHPAFVPRSISALVN